MLSKIMREKCTKQFLYVVKGKISRKKMISEKSLLKNYQDDNFVNAVVAMRIKDAFVYIQFEIYLSKNLFFMFFFWIK